jgi:glycogen synthase
MLGNMEKASLDIKDLDVSSATPRGGQGFVFTIVNRLNPNKSFDVAAESAEEMQNWVEAIKDTMKELADK